MGVESSKYPSTAGTGTTQASSRVFDCSGALLADQLPRVGLENFGNTCYVNSVIQALYWCTPFRQGILRYHENRQQQHQEGGNGNGFKDGKDESLLSCVADLFYQMQHSKKKVTRLPPRKLILKMRSENPVFASYQQQDAHEFFVYLLNDIVDTIKGGKGEGTVSSSSIVDTSSQGSAAPTASNPETFVQALFEGTLTAEMKCLCCESSTTREDVFLGLSLDVSPNVSLLSTLRAFSRGETMDRDNKFHCDACSSLQEARRSLRVKNSPPILCVHLKRFKYVEEYGRHCKLSYRVPFPFSIRLPVEGPQADDLYQLFAIVIHLGVGPNMGHYVCMAKTGHQWMLFDDESVSPISEREVAQGYGTDAQTETSTSTGYLLFYSSLPFVDASPIINKFVSGGVG